jgi:hypothetical protein
MSDEGQKAFTPVLAGSPGQVVFERIRLNDE